MNERNFFAELKRRNVYKVAVAYGGCCLAADAGRQPDFSIFRDLELVVRLVIVVLVVGFPVALLSRGHLK